MLITRLACFAEKGIRSFRLNGSERGKGPIIVALGAQSHTSRCRRCLLRLLQEPNPLEGDRDPSPVHFQSTPAGLGRRIAEFSTDKILLTEDSIQYNTNE
jgi:hypothetical protein